MKSRISTQNGIASESADVDAKANRQTVLWLNHCSWVILALQHNTDACSDGRDPALAKAWKLK
jgi:hypothetical protein